MDLPMPELGGLAAIRLLSAAQPQVRVVARARGAGAPGAGCDDHAGVVSGRLVVTDNTIKFHLRNILDKLHVHNRAEVVAYASRYGLAPPMPQ